MDNFTTKQSVLFYNYTIEVEQTSKIDKFLELLEASGVSEHLAKESSNQLLGRPEIAPLQTVHEGSCWHLQDIRDQHGLPETETGSSRLAPFS